MNFSQGRKREQLWLPFVPAELEQLGLRSVDVAPLCSMGRAEGFRDVARRPGEIAWTRYPHVQHHGTNVYTGVYLDVDRPVADVLAAVDGHRIPPPSLTVTRVENAHSQCGWVLSSPVHRYPSAGTKPLQLLARTAEYFADALGSDPGYTSLLFRNGPIHGARAGWHVEYAGPPGGWTLYELADWIPAGWRRPSRPLTAEGRNCALFVRLCRFAGSRAGRTADLGLEAFRINRTFAVPLGLREIGHIADHVEKYRERWEANGWHRPSWIARQARRGHKGGSQSGRSRRLARAPEIERAVSMQAEGVPVPEIARSLGRHRSTVYRWLRGIGVSHEANTRYTVL